MKRLWFVAVLLFAAFSFIHIDAKALNASESVYEFKIVKPDTLPIKQYRSNNSTTLATLKKDDVVYVIGKPYAGWIQIETKTYSGFVNNGLLTDVKGYGTPWNGIYTAIKKITSDHVAKDYDGKTVDGLKKGDLVEMYLALSVVGADVQSLGLKRYNAIVPPKYLQAIVPTIRMTTLKGGIAVKEKPSPSAKTITTLAQNMPVESYGQVAGGWRVIRYGNQIGYVKGAAMVAVKPTKKYVTAQGLPIYGMPFRAAEVYNILAQGVEVQVYSVSKGWSYVKVGAIGGYVPANMLSTKKPKLAKDAGLKGIKMDVNAIKPNITATEVMKNEKGQTVYVHSTSFGLGLQLAGSNIVYIQQNNGTNKDVAKQLTKQTGTNFFACNTSFLCQYENGSLVQAFDFYLDSNSISWFTVKSTGKGQIQVAGSGSDSETYDFIQYATYTFDAITKKLKLQGSAYYPSYEPGMEEKSAEYYKWQKDPSYVVRDALTKH